MSLREPESRLGNWPERTTRVIKATLKDENGAIIPGTSLTTMVFSLYSEHTLNILNNRNDVDIKSLVDAQGLLTFELTPSDMALENSRLLEEKHRLLFEWSYSAGAREGRHEMQIVVSNMEKVP